MKNLSFQLTKLESNITGEAMPDMLEVDIKQELYSNLTTCIAFLKAHDLDCITKFDACAFSLYVANESGSYQEFTPSYSVESCDIKVYKHGLVQFVVSVTDRNEELWSNEFSIVLPDSIH